MAHPVKPLDPADLSTRATQLAWQHLKLSALGAVVLMAGVAFYILAGVAVGRLIDWGDGVGLSEFDRRMVSILQVAGGVVFVLHGGVQSVVGLRLAYLAARANWKGE